MCLGAIYIMKKIMNMCLIIFFVVTLSSCGKNVDIIGGMRSIGVYNSKVYYQSNEYALEIDNGIYEITDNGYEIAYDLTVNQVGVSIVDGKFFILEKMFDNTRYPSSYKYSFVDIETKEVDEIPVINEDEYGLVYYGRYIEEDNCILFNGSINSTFYIYDIASNTYIYEYTLTGIDWPVSTSFYIDGMLYMSNDYHDYSYIYNFETETLIDVYDIEPRSLEGYYSSYPVYQYSDGINTFLFDSLRIKEGTRYYDIVKSDSDYKQIDIFGVPKGFYYDFSGTNFLIYEQNSLDGELSVFVYDLDFNLERSIDIDMTCEYVRIINEDMIECSTREDRGALLQTHHMKIEIYSLLTGDKLYDTGFVKISSQVKAINLEDNEYTGLIRGLYLVFLTLIIAVSISRDERKMKIGNDD